MYSYSTASNILKLFDEFNGEDQSLLNINQTLRGQWEDKKQAYLFELKFPGFAKEDVKIKTSDDDSLVVKAKNEKYGEKKQIIRFTSKNKYNLEKTKASVKNGIITLEIPKRQKTNEKYIHIT